jgi:hypothetical protein
MFDHAIKAKLDQAGQPPVPMPGSELLDLIVSGALAPAG